MNLIIYYSRKGQNYFGGAIRSIDKGNTEICAEYIQKAVGGDFFEIDTVKPYSEDYMTCTEEAKAELRANARPELKKMLTDIDKYDNIFICGPCWWGTYPCAVFTQLEALDFTGKRVFPLMTHGGSRHGLAAMTMTEDAKTEENTAGSPCGEYIRRPRRLVPPGLLLI